MTAKLELIFCIIFLSNFILNPYTAHLNIPNVSNQDDDLFESPDIEIDDSLSSSMYDSDIDYPNTNTRKKYDSEYSEGLEDSPDIYSSDVPSKKSSKELPPLKKDLICTPTDLSDFCQCQRSCYPNPPLSVSPCQCSGISGAYPTTSSTNYDNQQPPLLASQPSTPTFSSLLSDPSASLDCSSDQSDGSCTCRKACLPGIPINNDPCTCMAYDTSNQMGTPDVNYFNTFPQNDFSNGFYGLPQPDYSLFNNQFSTNYPHLDDNSCTRACMPYTVQQKAPCLCNFNLKSASNIEPYAPSMYPTGYDYPYQSYYDSLNQPAKLQDLNSPGAQRTSMGQTLNAHIPKVNRQPTSIGAYLGCFHDKKKTGRDLKMGLAVPKLTPDACVNKCREKKKRFAAVQNGYLCFCGSRFGRYNRTKDERCGTPCSGDPSKYCGGHWLNAVYSTDGQLYSPKQFSFKTRDPLDELEYDSKIRKQKKTKNHSKKNLEEDKPSKLYTGKKLNKILPAQSALTIRTPKDKKLKTKKSENKSKKSETRNYQSNKFSHIKSKQTALERASSPLDMAELIALGSKKSLKALSSKSGEKYLQGTRNKKTSNENNSMNPSNKLIIH